MPERKQSRENDRQNSPPPEFEAGSGERRINSADVIRFLPCLGIRHGKMDCRTCPWNSVPDRSWPFGCAVGQEQLIADAVTLIREQNQRIWDLLCENERLKAGRSEHR